MKHDEKLIKFLQFIILLVIFITIFGVFLITQAIAGSVGITWEAPKLREDGSALKEGEIGGYRVYYESNGTERVLEVAGNVTEARIDDLFGLYNFSVTTVDSNGLESKRSDSHQLLLTYQIEQIINLSISCQAPLVCVNSKTGEVYKD